MRMILSGMALGFAIAGTGLSVSAAETTLPSAESETTATPKAPPSESESSKAKQESPRPVVEPTPAESRTPEEASAHAADPRDPSGALIIKTPGAAGAEPLRACEKIVASEGRSRSAGAQDRFAGSETERKPRRGESHGWDEQPECMLKYMRIPSTPECEIPSAADFFTSSEEEIKKVASPPFPFGVSNTILLCTARVGWIGLRGLSKCSMNWGNSRSEWLRDVDPRSKSAIRPKKSVTDH